MDRLLKQDNVRKGIIVTGTIRVNKRPHEEWVAWIRWYYIDMPSTAEFLLAHEAKSRRKEL